MTTPMHRALLVSLTLCALACTPPPSKAGEAGEAKNDAPASPPTKAARAAEAAETAGPPGCSTAPLNTELLGYCDYDLGVPPIALATVPWTGPSYHPLATRVITLDGEGLTDPEGQGRVSVEDWLANPPRRLPEPGAMAFAIAAEVRVETLATLWAGLAKAGRQEIRVLVHLADDAPVPGPREPKMLADMRASLPDDHNERVMFVAKGVRGYAESCPPLAGVFPQLAQVAPGERCAKLAELGAAALVACECRQLPQVMTLMYALTVGFDVPTGRTGSVGVRLDPGQPVTAQAGQTWGALAPQVLPNADARGLWISAAPG